ncbi:MAG: alpha/beta hydrolase, partial [Candidatus Hodarchaeales archaeon]
FQTGEKDPLVIDADKLFSFVKAKDSTLKIYDGLFHEVYNELEEDRNRVLSDLNEWLDNHL